MQITFDQSLTKSEDKALAKLSTKNWSSAYAAGISWRTMQSLKSKGLVDYQRFGSLEGISPCLLVMWRKKQ